MNRTNGAADLFRRIGGVLHCEGVSLEEAARTLGTPSYVYSRSLIERNFLRYDEAFGEVPHLVCYAAKANSTLGILQTLVRLGAGFDIVSSGELVRVLNAGAHPARIVFSGVGKSRADIAAGLTAGIRCFNVESLEELERIDAVAASLGRTASVAMRVNPQVDPHTNARIATGHKAAKFGIPLERAQDAYDRAATLPHVRIVGISCHIGSQITTVTPYDEMADVLFGMMRRLEARGIRLEHIDFGGGAGVAYREGDASIAPEAIVKHLCARVAADAPYPVEILVEPGRSIVAEAGVLLTRVEYLKPMEGPLDCCIVDASMTELIRPTLYDAWHAIEPVAREAHPGQKRVNVVGPVCESSDWLGTDRELDVREGDLLAVRTAGAYGSSMASNYNSRPLPAEGMVSGNTLRLLRPAQRLTDLCASERGIEDTRNADAALIGELLTQYERLR